MFIIFNMYFNCYYYFYSLICLASHRYLFYHPKYKAQPVPETWQVAGTLLPTQNMRRNVYLPPVPVFPSKIRSQACTWGMAGRRYLITSPKNEERRVPATGTCFPTQNMKPSMYLRHGRSQVPYYQPKTWGATCTCHRYLFSHPKDEAGHVAEAWPIGSTCFPT